MEDTGGANRWVGASQVRWLVVVARAAFALLGFSAIVTEIATLLARGRFVAGNFFSYFTVESNALAVLSLMAGAGAAAAGLHSRRLNFARGAIALYMATVALVFAVLLSDRPADELTAVPWDNTVLHYLMPAAVVLDWLLSGHRAGVGFPRALLWLVVPAFYAGYSLVRGAATGWYPYPFLDPAAHGYPGVLLICLVVGIVLVALTWAIAGGPRWLQRACRTALR